ncbi:hypothetical protein MKX01_035978, partial [Papaver californicum]
MEVTNASKERIETTDDHPENASEGSKYDESYFNQLKLDCAAAEQDYRNKRKAYVDAKDKRMNGTV